MWHEAAAVQQRRCPQQSYSPAVSAAVLLKKNKIKSSTEKQSSAIIHEAKRTATSTRTTHTRQNNPYRLGAGAGGINRSMRPLLSSNDGARSCRNRPRCLLLYSSKKQNKKTKKHQVSPFYSKLNIFREGLVSEKGECSPNSGSGPPILGSGSHTKR